MVAEFVNENNLCEFRGGKANHTWGISVLLLHSVLDVWSCKYENPVAKSVRYPSALAGGKINLW